MHHFIEVTVVTDSADPLTSPRKAAIRADRITCVVDISSASYSSRAVTQICTEEPVDFIDEGDEAGGVVRAERSFHVLETYVTVRNLLDAAIQRSRS